MKTTPVQAAALIALIAMMAHADTFTWDGGGTDNNWATAANWNPDGAPAADGTAVLSFVGGTRTAAANNFSEDTVFAGINLLNDGTSGKTAAFTLSGTRLTLGGNITSTAASSAITDTLSLPFLLNASRTITVNNNHHLTVSGVIGETDGSWGLTKSGGGNLTLNGANTYTGPTTLGGGQVYFNAIKNIGEGASSFGAPDSLESGTLTTSSRLSYTGATTATDRPFVFTAASLNWDVSNSGTTLTLNGVIKGANAGPLFRGGGNFVINGLVDVGSAGVTRTDNGTVYLNCPTNAFTGNIQVSAGTISVTNIADSGVACPIGKGNTITVGQNGWFTTGRFRFAGPDGASCNRAIRVETTTNSLVHGGIIESAVAGKTLLLSGTVAPGSSSTARTPRLQLVGDGNGELSGVISGSVSIDKSGGPGTWILSGANTHTGTTTVSAGTLLVNGSTHADSAVTVASGGTFGGTGTVHGAVNVAAGGTLAPGAGGIIGTLVLARAGGAALTLNGGTLAFDLGAEAGTCDRIDIAGGLVLNGANTVTLPAGPSPAGTYTLMTYASRGGVGTLVLGTSDPGYRLTVGETALTLTISNDTLTWKGDDAANVWDTATPNWLDGKTPATYADGLAVIFDNAGSASPAISIAPDAVAPFSVVVHADTNAYTIGGAAITGEGYLMKTGTNRLSLTGANTYRGETFVSAGTLALSGSLSNSSVTVANGATFTQSASGVIAGTTATLIAYGSTTLAGTNTYGGETVIGLSGTPNIILNANNNAALGSAAGGTTVVGGNSGTENQLRLGTGVTVTGETLTLSSPSAFRAGLHYTPGSGSATWAGNIVLAGASAYLNADSTGGTLVVGASPADTITGVASALSLRGWGTVIVNSAIDIGSVDMMRDDPGTAILNAASNVMGNTSILQGTLRLGVSDALPATRSLIIGKPGNTAHAVFDLNGKDQTVSALSDQRWASGTGTQRIVSAAPATLTVNNASANSFGLPGSTIEGAVSLVKNGVGTLTLGGTNTTSGRFTVNAGTLALQNAAALSEAATLQIADGGGAKVDLAAGLNVTVGWLYYGDTEKRPGTYGAPGSGATYVSADHFSGTGMLTVEHGYGGTVIMLR